MNLWQAARDYARAVAAWARAHPGEITEMIMAEAAWWARHRKAKVS